MCFENETRAGLPSISKQAPMTCNTNFFSCKVIVAFAISFRSFGELSLFLYPP